MSLLLHMDYGQTTTMVHGLLGKILPKLTAFITCSSSCPGSFAVKETGVSSASSVRALDLGVVVACEKMKVDDQIKLCISLHSISKLTIEFARTKAQEQDDSKATLAPKISQEESWLSFGQEAVVIHNKSSDDDEVTFRKDLGTSAARQESSKCSCILEWFRGPLKDTETHLFGPEILRSTSERRSSTYDE
ncbi:hypothetical protein CTI12_AA581800 [Artemisia annua]|uniref:Uncharacterized protein n=1 Tax=Artemisia annua TaxID=35608 RepID=A0A2U1KNS2_ARTAN|nr:hypothetical protein CTI12_AA581800 [Artemisia annua]